MSDRRGESVLRSRSIERVLERLLPPSSTRTRKPPSGNAMIARGAPGSSSASGARAPAKVMSEFFPFAERIAIRSSPCANAAPTPPGSFVMIVYFESTSVVTVGETSTARSPELSKTIVTAPTSTSRTLSTAFVVESMTATEFDFVAVSDAVTTILLEVGSTVIAVGVPAVATARARILCSTRRSR